MPLPTSDVYKAMQASPDRVVADRVEIELPLWRTNLAPYPSPEGGTLGNWHGGAAHTLTGDPAISYVGRYSLRLDVAHGAAPGSTLTDPIAMGWAGDSVAGSVRIRIGSALSGPVGAYWVFSDADGATTGTSTPTYYGGAVTTGWLTLGNVAVLPAGTVTGTFALQLPNPATGGTNRLWVDGLLVERSDSIGTYFDGDVDATVNLFTNPRVERDLHDIRRSDSFVTLAIDSTWSPDGVGGNSVAITPTSVLTSTFCTLGGDAGTAHHGMAAGKTYTVSATVNVPAALTGTLNAYAASIVVFTDDGTGPVAHPSPQGPTGGGTQRVSVTVAIPVGTTQAWVRLYHGGAAGSGTVRWGRFRIIDNNAGGLFARGVTYWDDTRLASTSRLNVGPYLDFTDAFLSASVNRAVTTDLPPSVSLVDGVASASGTVALAGPCNAREMDETRDAFWLFNPHNADSPIYGLDLTGAAVRYWAGYYTGQAWSGDPQEPELLPKFIGQIDTLATDSRDQSVSITCIDSRGHLRGDIRLPAFAYQGIGSPDITDRGPNPGLLAGWCIDHLLRGSGIHSSPPPRDLCMLYAGFNGSAYPDVFGADPQMVMKVGQDAGSYTDDATGSYPYGAPSDYLAHVKAGPWHPQCVKGPQLYDVPSASTWVPMTTGGSFFIEGDVYLDSTGAASTPSYYNLFGIVSQDAQSNASIVFDISGGTSAILNVLVSKHGSGVVVPTALAIPLDTWRHIAIQFQWATADTVQLTLWSNYAETPIIDTASGLPTGLVYGTGSQVAWISGWLDSVQITAESNPEPAPLFKPQAYLDASRNALYTTVETQGQDPWQTMQDLAAAELGFAAFDDTDQFQFLNRDSLAAVAAARIIDADVDLTAFGTEAARSAVADRVQIPTAGWRQSRQLVDVWSAPEPIQVTRSSTYTQRLTTSAPADAYKLGSNEANPGKHAATSHVVGATEWRAAKSPSGWGPVLGGITVYATSISPTVIEVTVQNFNNFDVWLVSDQSHSDVTAGTPFLYIAGYSLTALTTSPVADSQWPPKGQGGAASNRRGEVVLALAVNAWRQDFDSMAGLADDLLAQTYKPRHQWKDIPIIGDPSIQLTDRVTAIDAASGLADDAYIFAHTFASANGTWSSTLSLRAVATPGAWLLGVPSRSEMGVTSVV